MAFHVPAHSIAAASRWAGSDGCESRPGRFFVDNHRKTLWTLLYGPGIDDSVEDKKKYIYIYISRVYSH